MKFLQIDFGEQNDLLPPGVYRCHLINIIEDYGSTGMYAIISDQDDSSLWKTCYIIYIGKGFHQCVSLDVYQDYLSLRKPCYIDYICMVYHQCVPLDV